MLLNHLCTNFIDLAHCGGVGIGNTPIFHQQNYYIFLLSRKGASLIRMMEHFLTKEILTQGIRNYLKENLYQNVVKDDLWKALTDVARNEVKHSFSLPLSLSLSLSLTIFLTLYLSLFNLSVTFFTVPVSFCLFLSFFHSFFLCVLFCVSVSLCLSLSLFLCLLLSVLVLLSPKYDNLLFVLFIRWPFYFRETSRSEK